MNKTEQLDRQFSLPAVTEKCVPLLCRKGTCQVVLGLVRRQRNNKEDSEVCLIDGFGVVSRITRRSASRLLEYSRNSRLMGYLVRAEVARWRRLVQAGDRVYSENGCAAAAALLRGGTSRR